MQNKAIRDFKRIRADIILPKRLRKAMRRVIFRVAFSRLNSNRFTVVVSTFVAANRNVRDLPPVVTAA